MPSSDSRPTDDLLAAKMGRLSVFSKWSMVIGLGQICSTCLDSHASEVLAKVSECLVKASGNLKFLDFIGLAFLLYDLGSMSTSVVPQA